jgi:hypothetical protein
MTIVLERNKEQDSFPGFPSGEPRGRYLSGHAISFLVIFLVSSLRVQAVI